jgi:hypothetical protein
MVGKMILMLIDKIRFVSLCQRELGLVRIESGNNKFQGGAGEAACWAYYIVTGIGSIITPDQRENSLDFYPRAIFRSICSRYTCT